MRILRGYFIGEGATTNLAENEGFEPSKGCPLHAFQACALGRYANSPVQALGVITTASDQRVVAYRL